MDMKKILKDESGIALITALLIMVLLTLLGTAAILTSTTDVKISANMKKSIKAFYSADAGTNIAPALIERAFTEINAGNTKFTDGTGSGDDYDIAKNNGTDLFTELSGSSNSAATVDYTNDAAFTFTSAGNLTTKVDIDFIEVRRIAGGSTEAQSRYEGIGAGGSFFIDRFRIRSQATSTSGTFNEKSEVEAFYLRKQD